MAFFIYIMEVEIWKDVPNYDGEYQVSSFGRIKSLKYNKEKLLKLCIGKRGYALIYLSKNNKQKTYPIHVLVAIAFYGYVPDGTTNGLVVDHIDNNKLNNNVENLRLVSNRENCSKDKKNKTSMFTGVAWDKSKNKWVVIFRFKGRQINLGLFKIEIDAKNAYDKALSEWEQGLDLNLLYPKGRNKSSQYLGVSWHKQKKKWQAKYKGKYIGIFKTELEAHEAVHSYILQLQVK